MSTAVKKEDQKPLVVEVTSERVGWRTSEFWLTLVPPVIIAALIAIGRITVEDAERLWPLFAGSGLYAIGRSMVKRGGGS
jgi:hypothetical protein